MAVKIINLHPALVCESGLLGWHGGQGDPLYAVLSRYVAGDYVWDESGTRTLIEADGDEIEAVKRGLEIMLENPAECRDPGACGVREECEACAAYNAAACALHPGLDTDQDCGLDAIGDGPEEEED